MVSQTHGQNFPKGARLITSEQFKRVFELPLKFHTQTFSILARRNEADTARLGLAISKKAVRTAVQRNRLKRLARESFRVGRTSLRGLDIVVLGRRGMADLENRKLFDLLEKAWKKLERDAKNR